MRKRTIVAIIVTVFGTLLMTFVFGSLSLIQSVGVSPSLSYRSLDYDVLVDRNGDLEITQKIDVRLAKRTEGGETKPWKQLYQQYTLKSDNLTGISDIHVTNITKGIEYEESDEYAAPDAYSDATWNAEQANRWYIAKVNGGGTTGYETGGGEVTLRKGVDGAKTAETVELGWNIPATESADSLTFNIRFTMHGVGTKWDDVAAFQWEPFGTSNQVPIGTVTGKVRFPLGVDTTNSWAWLHTEQRSETSRGKNGTLDFTVHDVRSGDYLDLVAAFDADEASNVARTRSGTHLDALKRSEAEQERQWRDKQQGDARARLIYWSITLVAGIVMCALSITAVVTSRRRSHYRGPIEYWRDKPAVSPAAAARLIDVVDPEGGRHRASRTNRALTATLLSLSVKKAIAVYPGPATMYVGIDLSRAVPAELTRMIDADPGRRHAAGRTRTIVLLPRALDRSSAAAAVAAGGLTDSEKALLDLLVAISRRVGSPVFDFDQMDAACRGWKDGYIELNRFINARDSEYWHLHVSKSVGWRWIVSGVFTTLLGFGTMLANVIIGHGAVGLLLGMPVFTIGLFCSMSGAMNEIMPKGQEAAGQCLGLKRYMDDFSDFTDRGTADIALWDWYMVYAAAFGMSDKLKRELADAYPQLADPAWLDGNASGSTLYWDYRTDPWRDGPRAYGYGGPGNGAGSSFSSRLDRFFGIGPYSANGSGLAGFGDLGSQLSAGISDITSTIDAASPSSSSGSSGGIDFGSSGSFDSGGFGGSSGGSGGGSFGGR
ncbi:DUF2207 domain-containing protein [Bifidobacterium parmae]|uniref:DUF2207 domain-containing protein n=1 Tax=Bifidobacterium parmae TaxID=361854 RepID=A0A2N5J5Y0_9BIFI|nr:DUF2207 domain-containing protein [Bifidobacterium parmae]PLS29621.1 hypothetical protein Uis4E_0258 [Bifidobacterium parmae]